MKTSIVKELILLTLAVVACTISKGQQSDSLMNYLEIAAKNNPTVLQKLAEYEASLQKVPQAGSLPDPELSTGIFLSPMELVGGKQVADIRLMQMFPWFGQLKAAKNEMSLMAKAKFETLRDAKLQVFYDVQRTYFELQKIDQSIRISEENLEILRTVERLSLVKFKSAAISPASSSGGSLSQGSSAAATVSSGGMSGGMGGNSGSSSPAVSAMPSAPMASSGGSGLADLYQVQIEISELENSISLLKNQRQTVAARFNSYLNRKPQTPVQLAEKLTDDSLNVSLQTVSDSMLQHNPMLGMLQYEQQSLDARKEMVTKMGYPMVGLGLNYSLIGKAMEVMTAPEMNGKDMVMPMVTVTLPIYRKKYKAMQEEVKLQKTATEQGFQATANALQTEYYEAIQLFQDAQRRIKLYQNQADLANKSLNILMKSFSASGSGLTDLLRIQQQTLDYETRQIEAIADNNTAIAWLKRLMANSKIQ
ncbi:MAG: TolC family protein [Prolixibacteraceae bacterium]|nr:TolC family protein [Prolixibacteraceae bacterium]